MTEAITGAAALPRLQARPRVFAVAGFLALFAASVSLFLVSRGKWSDAIVDSGREWIVPDALARGELLYRDVVYWFGPFTPYFHAAFFALFGSSFRTLVIAGVVGSLGLLAALYFALNHLAGRREAMLAAAVAIPALVFMPRAGGSILGMGFRMWHAAAFALVAVTLAGREGRSRPVLRVAAIGTFAALSGLCRTEWGVATLCGALVAEGFRDRFRRRFWRNAVTLIAWFAVVFGGALAFFVAAAGRDSVLADGHVLFAGLPEETRFFLARMWIPRDWRAGILQLLYSAALWTAAFLLIEFLAVARRDRDRVRRRLPWIAGVHLFLALYPEYGGARATVLYSGAPFLCIAAIAFGLRDSRRTRRAALVGFGVVGLMVCYRRILLISDSPYVGPSLLFALVCATLIACAAVQGERDPVVRLRLRNGFSAAFLILAAVAFAVRWTQYASDERVPVPGTHRMLAGSPDVARELTRLSQAIRRETDGAEGLVVFPDGEVLNCLAGRNNPIRHKLYIPGYLTDENEERVLQELEEATPAAVVILDRPTPEYGRRRFGENYGRRLRRWIDENYEPRSLDRGEAGKADEPSGVFFAVRKR